MARPPTPPTSTARSSRGLSAKVRDAARTAAWLAGLSAGVSALGALLAAHQGGSLAVQAFMAEWGAGRLGVSWSDPEAPLPSSSLLIRRLVVGAAIGAGSAALVLLFAVVTRAVVYAPASLVPSQLGLGLAVALFSAVRDELLLRGLVLRAFRHSMGTGGQLIVCGAVAAAARVGQLPDVPYAALLGSLAGWVSLLGAFLVGVSFAALWLRERGAWTACGAHTAWTFATSAAIAGPLPTPSWALSVWGGAGFDASLATATAVLLLAVAAVLWSRRRPAGENSSVRSGGGMH